MIIMLWHDRRLLVYVLHADECYTLSY